MAGFAVFMEFLTWGVILLAVACVLSMTLYLRARGKHPENNPATQQFRVVSAAAPFASLLWIIVALNLHTILSNRLAH